MAKPRAFVFDAYGTLFDVQSVVLRAGISISGDPRILAQLWRRKQIEYTWRRAIMERYQHFWHVTEEALRWAVKELRIDATEQQIDRLMQAYLSPAVFSEVRAALEALKGSPLAILSNGSPQMLESALVRSDLGSYFSHVISVDGVGTYKPSPSVYAAGCKTLGLAADQVLFTSANAWDAAGAKAYGYRVCWCNRSGEAEDDLGFAPDFIVKRLDQIAANS
jgi:2-haloacid dehalogenase